MVINTRHCRRKQYTYFIARGPLERLTQLIRRCLILCDADLRSIRLALLLGKKKP